MFYISRSAMMIKPNPIEDPRSPTIYDPAQSPAPSMEDGGRGAGFPSGGQMVGGGQTGAMDTSNAWE